MARTPKNRPTVADLIKALKQFPPDAEWWAYEGEVSGIIIAGKKVSGTITNSGEVEGPRPIRRT